MPGKYKKYTAQEKTKIALEALKGDLTINEITSKFGVHATQANPEHKKFPYLLRDVSIEYPNQVWSTDITYIKLKHSFIYLMAIIDWYSRYVLDWEISNSLEADFCIEALERVLENGQCEIFNTDQGSQFTTPRCTDLLIQKEIDVSMDGKGRALDNIFVERL